MIHKVINIVREIGYKYGGIFNIQGVPMNARRESKVIVDGGGVRRVVPNAKLLGNERLMSLESVLGLQRTRTYTTDAELSTLNYGRVVVSTDQDVDGLGNIFGLILSHFERFWPALVARGFIQRLATPLIRAYRRGSRDAPIAFYCDADYRDWLEREHVNTNAWTIRYFKGLASNEPRDTREIAANFARVLKTYVMDAESDDAFETFFGPRPAARKKVLRDPVDRTLQRAVTHAATITCTQHLFTDTKEYQRDNIVRKLLHVVDGLVPARRKVLQAALHLAGRKKVFEFGGIVANATGYHHGNDSLMKTIIGMATASTGANQFPYLRSHGAFGDRQIRDQVVQPRYVWVSLNRAVTGTILEQHEHDLELLEWVIDEGKRCEPVYFAPMLPMAIMESTDIPAHGWSISTVARDAHAVVEAVRARIRGAATTTLPLPPSTRGYRYLRWYTDGAREVSVGRAVWDPPLGAVIVDELPHGVYTDTWISEMRTRYITESQVFTEIADRHGVNENHVKVVAICTEENLLTLAQTPHWAGALTGNPLIGALHLAEAHTPNLNFIDVDEAVAEYATYAEVLDAWFETRRDLLIRNIERRKVRLDLRIRMLRNMIRFDTEHVALGISGLSPERADAALASRRYEQFAHTLIETRCWLPTAEFAAAAVDPSRASYTYLLDLRYTDLLEPACRKRRALLAELERERAGLDVYDRFPGDRAWLATLEKFVRLVDAPVDDAELAEADTQDVEP
jgi:DNA topoisomerase-2